MMETESFVLTYQLKEGTTTSYYLTSGEPLLPGRISISLNEFAPIQSRKLPELKVGQMKGKFRKYESSPYLTKARTIHTTIWKPQSYINNNIIGTGDLKNTSSLLIFESIKKTSTIRIHVFPTGKFRKSRILQSFIKK